MNHKSILGIAILLLCLIPCLLFGITYHIWQQEFHTHYDTDEALAYSVDEFDGLECQALTFTSDQGQKLAGYLYTYEGMDAEGVIIMAHGFGGGGHNSYMPIAAYFAKEGYYVFAYDSTGCDASEGDDIKGLPQGVIDLSHAISYAETLPQLEDQPVFLLGHSWGAYCACSVLVYHPEVKAVVSMSGFNSSIDLIRAEAKETAGALGCVLVPFAKLIEKAKLGSYADCTSMKGFSASDAAVMVIQGTEDDQIPLSYGYDLYQKNFRNDDRFTFLLREGRGHDDVYWSDAAAAYRKKFNEQFQEDYEAAPSMTSAELSEWRMNYLKENLDRDILDHVIDEGLFDKISEFYRDHEK